MRTVATPSGYQQVVGGVETHEQSREASDARGGARPPAPLPPLAPADFGTPKPVPAAGAVPAPGLDMATLVALGGRPTGGGGGGTSSREYDAAQADKRKAINDAAAVEERGNNEIARIKMEGVRQDQAFAAEQKERQAAQRQALDDSMAQYAAGLKDLQTPSGTLDPNRWWASRDTGQKIASFASAFLSGFAGRPDAIQQEIDADIAAQKYNFDRLDRAKAARLEGFKTMYSMNMDRFKDENTAAVATRAQAWDTVTHQMESIVAGMKGASARPQAALMIAGAREEAAKYKNQLAEQAAARADRQFARNLEIAKFQMEYNLKEQALAAKGAKGAGGKPVEQGEAVKLGTYNGALSQLDALEKSFNANIGAFSGLTQYLPGTSATKYTDQLKAAAQAIGYIMEGGKLTESDLGRYMDLLPQPGDGADRARAKLANIKAIMEQRRDDSINGLTDAGADTSAFTARQRKPDGYTSDKKPAT